MNKNFENSPYLPQKNRLFQNLITGQPVVGEKNKKFGRHKYTWLHIATNRLLISGMVWWAMFKKSYFRQL